MQMLAIGLTVRPGSDRAILLNGEAITGDHDLVRDEGTTIEVKQQIMFLYTRRPMEMPPLRFAKVAMPFGERDQHGMIGESPAM